MRRDIWQLHPVDVIVSADHMIETMLPVHCHKRHSIIIVKQESSISIYGFLHFRCISILNDCLKHLCHILRDWQYSCSGIRLCGFYDIPRHAFTKGKVEALNKFLAWLIPYECEFETEEELIAILSKINKKVCERICDETGVPPIPLFQKEKEYLQSLPSEKVLESYLTHDCQTTVRKDSMVTYMKNKYSVPADYVGKPVRLKVSNESLQIYYSTDLIATHSLSDKRLNYKKEHYTQLLSGYIKNDDDIAALAEMNLRQMDALL